MAIKAPKTKVDKKAPPVDNPEALGKRVNQVREEAFVLKRNMLSGDVQNVRAYKYKRRELARLLTRVNQSQKEEQ